MISILSGEMLVDSIDRRILVELQRDGSLSTAALAERVGASQPSCWRRLRAMEADGVLGHLVRLVNQSALGPAVTVICYVRMKDHTPESSIEFRKFIITVPEVMECYSMSGEWDYFLKIVAKDVQSYEDFLMRAILNHPTVASAASNFAMSKVKYTTELPIT